MSKHLSSTQNPTIKRILQLQSKAKKRKEESGFIIEGVRELGLCLAGGYDIREVYLVSEWCSIEKLQSVLHLPETVEIITLSAEVYKKIAYRDSTEGVIAFAKAKTTMLSELVLPKNPLIMVAEAPEKPGNIGALLRTADAARVDAFIIANPKTDLYNPNIIRSSVGCVFTNQVAMASSEEVIAYLEKNEVAIYSAILQEAISYTTPDYTTSTAIVVGTEATGLSALWRANGKTAIKIPMDGVIDSMNVSVAAGILIFEAKRQRSMG